MNGALDRSIDIRQLRYFLVVAEELNFRRAAERLHLTQPPLSRQIAALEAALGVRLFEREGQRTRLTAAGQEARTVFAQAVDTFEAALTRVASAARPGRERLRIGLPWWADMSEFGPFEQALRTEAGIAVVEPVVANSLELLEQLRRGEVDVALITMPQDLKGLTNQVIAQVRHVAMVPAASALARKRALRLRELEALPAFLRFQKRLNPALWNHFQRQFDALGFKPSQERNAPGSTATISQIAAGRGCTLMPAAFARQRYPGVVARRLLDEISVDVHLVLAEGLDRALAEVVRAHMGSLQATLA